MKFMEPKRVMAVVLLLFLCSTLCHAGEEPAATESTEVINFDFALGLKAIAAALAVGLCAIGTAIAQSRIGAAGCGALAEKPELSGTVILLVAIPETMVILGFVVAVVLLLIQ